jgi:hypothetical protein
MYFFTTFYQNTPLFDTSVEKIAVINIVHIEKIIDDAKGNIGLMTCR